jgi:hypothetical protein
LNALYAGTQADGLALLAPFIALNPIVSSSHMITYPNINGAAFFGQGDQAKCQGPGFDLLPVSNWGLGVKRTDVPTLSSWFAKLTTLYQNNPALRRISLTIQRFPNDAVKAVPCDSTAYSGRSREIISHL